VKRSTPDQKRQSLDVVREGVVEERTDSRSCPLFLLSSRDTIIPKFVKIMSQVITAKLKLKLTAEQKALVSQIALAYRDALNYTSQVAFDAGKTSNGAKLQKAVYNELRVRFGLLERKWLAMYPDKCLEPIRLCGLR
jgi:predicted transposase